MWNSSCNHTDKKNMRGSIVGVNGNYRSQTTQHESTPVHKENDNHLLAMEILEIGEQMGLIPVNTQEESLKMIEERLLHEV